MLKATARENKHLYNCTSTIKTITEIDTAQVITSPGLPTQLINESRFILREKNMIQRLLLIYCIFAQASEK